jgi:hypothetical protein
MTGDSHRYGRPDADADEYRPPPACAHRITRHLPPTQTHRLSSTFQTHAHLLSSLDSDSIEAKTVGPFSI